MPDENQNLRCILFVDDDTQFLELMQELMPVFSAGRWQVRTAPGASQAFALLQQQPVDLAVIDVQMPVMDGIQMLSLLNRGYPHLPKVALTGFTNASYRAACLNNGADLFLEKPKSRDELQSLYASLNELLKLGRPAGFRGVMRRVELAELIQVQCAEKSTTVLAIQAEGVTGRVFIRAGVLIHATAGGRKGREALTWLLARREADIRLTSYQEPPEQTLDRPWEELLLPAIAVPPSAPGAAALPAGPRLAVDARATAGPARGVAPPAEKQPAVEEVLICSAQGEVLHEWRCREVDMWVRFLEFVSQKSQRMAQAVALGEFDRLEILREDARIVVLIGSDRGVMIRTRRDPGRGATENAPAAQLAGRLTFNDAAREHLSQWLRRAPSPRGILLRGIRFPDQTMTCDLDSRDASVVALEQAVRSVADTFQVLFAQQLFPHALVWTYRRGVLHCVRRHDGAILAVVSRATAGDTDAAGLRQLLSEFHLLDAPAS